MYVSEVKNNILWSVENDPKDPDGLLLHAIGCNNAVTRQIKRTIFHQHIQEGKFVWDTEPTKIGTEKAPITWLIHDLVNQQFINAALCGLQDRTLTAEMPDTPSVEEIGVVAQDGHLIAKVTGRSARERDTEARSLAAIPDVKLLLVDVLHLLTTDSDLETVSNPRAYRLMAWKLRVALAHLNGWDLSPYQLQDLWEKVEKEA